MGQTVFFSKLSCARGTYLDSAWNSEVNRVLQEISGNVTYVPFLTILGLAQAHPNYIYTLEVYVCMLI